MPRLAWPLQERHIYYFHEALRVYYCGERRPKMINEYRGIFVLFVNG